MGRAHCVIGVDEVGRGPLAGPLCVGACLVRARLRRRALFALSGVRDCKQLTPEKRHEWFSRIAREAKQGTLCVTSSFVSPSIIDRKGLAYALRLAIRRCLKRLIAAPGHALIQLDGGLCAPARYPFQETIVGGDEREPLIAAASIVAKVRRDRYMIRLAKKYPAYGFEIHKGYGTKRHYEALRRHGISEVHRRSFLKNFAETIHC